VLYKDYALQTGVDGMGLDWAVPLEWARDELQPHVTLQGNVDPLLLVQGGEALDAAVDRTLAILGKGRFIANLGHGIVPGTPPENVDRLVKRFRGRI
jgi:uroporphyrinogen decarboxylase